MRDERLSSENHKFIFISVIDDRFEEIKKDTEEVLTRTMELPSEDMAINTLVGSDKAWYNMENFTRIATEHFEGEKFGELLKSGRFDLIVVEDSATIPAIKVLVRLETPIVAIMPLAETK